jgi:hypothetical protein
LRTAVDATSAKARQAQVAVALAAASNIVPLLVATAAPAGSWLAALAYAGAALRLAAVVLYCQWLYRAHGDVVALGGAAVVRPAAAVQAFFIPVANLYMPYRVVRDLHAASDPSTLHDPPEYKPTAGTQYRSSGLERVVRPGYDLWFPVREWWATYMVIPLLLGLGGVVLGFASPHASALVTELTTAAYGGLQVGSAVLAICVVRSIVARQRERLRRLEAIQAADGGGRVTAGFEAPAVRVGAPGHRVAGEDPVAGDEAVEAEAPGAAGRAGK